MPNNPFFSIIIPLYNKEDYIKNTLNCVINQNYQNFEIIIVNDGSTDRSINIVNQFKDSRIVIINQENQGLSAARNVGITAAKGEIIALIDADDLWNESFLKSIYSLYCKFPEISFFGTDYSEKYNNNLIIETKKNININLKNKEFIIDDFFLANKFQSIICQSSIAFKKNSIKDGLFDKNINYSEDVDFYLKNFTKHKLAYFYAPMATILRNVPNQITKIGIKNKTIPNLNKYEKKNPNNKTLKEYLDFKRYMYAIQYKLSKDKISFNNSIKHINYKNLSSKQIILLKSPLFLLNLLRFIKKFFLKHNMRLTSFNN